MIVDGFDTFGREYNFTVNKVSTQLQNNTYINIYVLAREYYLVYIFTSTSKVSSMKTLHYTLYGPLRTGNSY